MTSSHFLSFTGVSFLYTFHLQPPPFCRDATFASCRALVGDCGKDNPASKVGSAFKSQVPATRNRSVNHHPIALVSADGRLRTSSIPNIPHPEGQGTPRLHRLSQRPHALHDYRPTLPRRRRRACTRDVNGLRRQSRHDSPWTRRGQGKLPRSSRRVAQKARFLDRYSYPHLQLRCSSYLRLRKTQHVHFVRPVRDAQRSHVRVHAG